MNRSDTPRLLICALRCIGAATFLVPAVGARTFGVNADTEGTYLVRLFAARNVALIGGLAASSGQGRRLWYQAGIACDVLDIAAGLLGLRSSEERSSTLVHTGASLLATLLGVAGLVMDRAEEKPSP
jgi:hypothetical protein